MVAEGDRLTVLEYDMTEQEFSKTNTNPFGMVGAHEVDPQLDGENPQHNGVINAWGGAILRGEPLIAGCLLYTSRKWFANTAKWAGLHLCISAR